mmetsp:Transcript_38793/g.88137  ORF Transcript_38793/g.88137 Transcript_38793/m.88137 type:complete len:231 (+) Transcript_38793:468-1160(+)
MGRGVKAIVNQQVEETSRALQVRDRLEGQPREERIERLLILRVEPPHLPPPRNRLMANHHLLLGDTVLELRRVARELKQPVLTIEEGPLQHRQAHRLLLLLLLPPAGAVLELYELGLEVLHHARRVLYGAVDLDHVGGPLVVVVASAVCTAAARRPSGIILLHGRVLDPLQRSPKPSPERWLLSCRRCSRIVGYQRFQARGKLLIGSLQQRFELRGDLIEPAQQHSQVRN